MNATTKKRSTPLILASSYGHLDVVKLLVEKNATVDHKADAGCVNIPVPCIKKVANNHLCTRVLSLHNFYICQCSLFKGLQGIRGTSVNTMTSELMDF